MSSIQVDFEVFKELTARRTSESVTENDVLRGLLGLNDSIPKSISKPETRETQGAPWVNKGVVFPHNTEFRATYKGQQYTGAIDNGALVINGERFSSPSAAAVSITENPVNGWRFWECRLPGTNRWKIIASMRKRGS